MTVTFVHDGREPMNDVAIDDHTWVVTGCVIEVRDEPDLEADVDIYVRYDEAEGRTVAAKVIVLRREGGPEVTSRMLRAVRVRDYMQQRDPLLSYDGTDIARLRAAMVEAGRFGEGRFAYSVDALIAEARRDDSWAELKYRWAFRIYRWAQMAGKDDPTKQVADYLETSDRTASRWISRARELGYFN